MKSIKVLTCNLKKKYQKKILGEKLVQIINKISASQGTADDRVNFINIIRTPEYQTSEKIVAVIKYIFLLQKQQKLAEHGHALLIHILDYALFRGDLDPKIAHLITLMINKKATQADINALLHEISHPINTDPRKVLRILHDIFFIYKICNLHSDILHKLEFKILSFEQNWPIYYQLLNRSRNYSPLATYFCALFIENGYGVKHGVPDQTAAFHLLQESAKNGCMHAEYYLAQRYKEGRTPEGKHDYTAAFKCLLSTANNGHGYAHFRLYEWFKDGKAPLKGTNMSLALIHLKFAADYFIVSAQIALALHQLFGVHTLDVKSEGAVQTQQEFKFEKTTVAARAQIFTLLKSASDRDEQAKHIFKSFTDQSLCDQLPEEYKTAIQKMLNHQATYDDKCKLINFMNSFLDEAETPLPNSKLEALFYYLIQNYIINIDCNIYQSWAYTLSKDKNRKLIVLLENKIEFSPLLKCFLATMYDFQSSAKGQIHEKYRLIIKAIKYFEQAAYAGCTHAQERLFELYLQRDWRNVQRAHFYLECAAQNGNTNTQFELAYRHLTSSPVKYPDSDKTFFVPNKTKGLLLLTKAAALASPKAQYLLAELYLNGFEDGEVSINPNPPAAYELCKKSAENGWVMAIMDLANFHQKLIDFKSNEPKPQLVKSQTANALTQQYYQNNNSNADQLLPPSEIASLKKLKENNPSKQKPSSDDEKKSSARDEQKSPVEIEMDVIIKTPTTENDALLAPKSASEKQPAPSMLNRIWQQRTYGTSTPGTITAGSNIDSTERKLMQQRKP